MADNLPLIPGKGGTCADVRPVLREVFQEMDYLPQLHSPDDDKSPNEWWKGAQYQHTCAELRECASSVRRERAARLARVTPHNTFALRQRHHDRGDVCDVAYRPSYKIVSSTKRGDVRPSDRKKQCERKHALLRRKDLLPPPNSTAARDGTLWVENILSRSSGDVSDLEVARTVVCHGPAPSPAFPPEPSHHYHCHQHYNSLSDESVELSLGPVTPYVTVRPPPSIPKAPLTPQTVVCVPPRIDFINFIIGQSHTVMVRVVNVSSAEVRLAVMPPARCELSAALGGRLTVTSGAATELFITFIPKDTRALSDKLTVRVSLGCDHVLPIECYYVPPVLDVLVPSVTWSSLSCDAGMGGDVAKSEAGKNCKEAVVDLGARLLGDVHFAKLLLHSDASHAQFFILTEDAWVTCDVAEVQWDGSLHAEQFVLQPVWWRGGGTLRGSVWCVAQNAELQEIALRVLSSTAVVRPLHILADSLYFRPDHITLQAHDKDYDICSDDDPACQYYVNLGTAFPHRTLSATVTLLNHSPVTYSYCWIVRQWGKCSCWFEEVTTGDWLGDKDDPEQLCVGAIEARDRDLQGTDPPEAEIDDPTRLVRVEPARGTASARSSFTLHVCAPDVGGQLGTRRAVLMLILKDIPKESFPSDFEPMVLNTTTVQSESIPGMETGVREVCDVVYLQLEVWWEVAPVRFVIDPPIVILPHSRRVKQIDLRVRATQLFGRDPVEVRWRNSTALTASACPHECTVASVLLAPGNSANATLHVLLPSLPNEQSHTDIITLDTMGTGGAPPDWMARVKVVSRCDTRHAALSPARVWLGVVPPGQNLRAVLSLRNNTYQHIFWSAKVWRWYGENEPSTPCEGRKPCTECREAVCSCGLLRPTRGALDVDCTQELVYDVNAPNHDGCVVTLVRVAQCDGDVDRAPSLAGSDARATLLAFRVLAPRLTLRILPCSCDDTSDCAGYTLNTGKDAKNRRHGSCALRPERPLSLGRRVCYRLRITNLTPTATTVAWLSPPDGEEYLKIMFIPNQFNVGSFADVEIKMVLEPRRVVGRRLWARCATVVHAYRPLYLLVDACIAGVEVEIELPLGGEEIPTAAATFRKTQRELYPWESPRSSATPAQDFAVEDEHRRIVRESVCSCKRQLVYDPPARPMPPDPLPEDYCCPEIVLSPAVRRECPCGAHHMPLTPVDRPLCLQFWAVPLKTVRSRTIWLRSTSVVTTRWNACVRRWPRVQCRTIEADRWATSLRAPGIALQVSPARGVLAANARVPLSLRIYADTWGIYHDQLLIQMEHLDPLVVDVWVEAVGSPLQFALKPQFAQALLPPGPPLMLTKPVVPRKHVPSPSAATADYSDVAPVVWISATDEDRCVRARNTSRSALAVHAYMLREEDPVAQLLAGLSAESRVRIQSLIRAKSRVSNEREHHKYPLRLYLRLFDLPPGVCSCLDTFLFPSKPSFSDPMLPPPELNTGIELYLGEDLGPQDFTYYEVEPEVSEVAAACYTEWRVRARPDGPLFKQNVDPYTEPRHTLLLRLIPLDNVGEWWRRPEPTARKVRVCGVVREGQLCVSVSEIRVDLCALDLPPHDTLRVRKRFRVQNVGAGGLECCVRAADPWCVVRAVGMRTCGAGCHADRPEHVLDAHISLPPRASEEMCVEVCIVTREVWPAPAPQPWLLRCSSPCPPPCGPQCKPPQQRPCPARLYADTSITTEKLRFYNNDTVIMTLPLVLHLFFPVVRLQPQVLDFGYVWVSDTRKSYFEVSHTSRTKTLNLVVQWIGSNEFSLEPQRLRLAPDTTQRVYVQYTAEYRSSPAVGWMVVQFAGEAAARDSGAGTWCRAAAFVRAEPSRDYRCHQPPHDYTDDTCLLPPIYKSQQ